MNKRLTKISKYLTFILRHHPEAIGMQLDPEGWLNIDDLIKNANLHGKSITHAQLHEVVASNGENRYTLSDDRLRIRVN
ncbi:MAG: RNA 2'-phosphotransferase [Novipirellula sp. JB048]